MRKVLKIAVITAVIMCMATNAFAISLLQPYGYKIDLAEFAADSSKFASENNLSITSHDLSYSDGVLHFTGNTNALSAMYVGGKAFNGDTATAAPVSGKQINTLTFSMNKSSVYTNGVTTSMDTYDCNTFVRINGSWANIKLQGATAGADSYSMNLVMSSPSSTVTVSGLQYGEFYSAIVEGDAVNHCISMRIVDSEGTIKGALVVNNAGIDAIRSGFRFRAGGQYDFDIKEMSTYRESYLTKEQTVEDLGDKLKASVKIANDCTVRTAYGTQTKPVLVIGQYDAENRLVSYKMTPVEIAAKDASAADAQYSEITAELEKHRDYDHAIAMVWTDAEGALMYGDASEIQ